MDNKFPFTSYDFWAYLSAGFLLLFVLDYVAGTTLLARNSWTLVQGIVAVASAYAVGQLVSSVSAAVFERVLVGRLLGYPRMLLFGKVRAAKGFRIVLPGYFLALPVETQRAALKRGNAVGIESPGEALFWAAYAHARATPEVMSRLENFLNLYGFCRNTALVALIDAVLLAGSHWWHSGPQENLYWAVAALLVGLGMALRYLKFYRHYAVEIFTAFAYGNDAKKAR